MGTRVRLKATGDSARSWLPWTKPAPVVTLLLGFLGLENPGMPSLIVTGRALVPHVPHARQPLIWLGLLAAIAILIVMRDEMPLPVQVPLWCLVLVGLGILAQRPCIRLLGPVFVYDLVRTGRRGHVIFHRCFYAGLILAALYFSYPGNAIIGTQERAQYAESCFNMLLGLQFTAVLLFTPLYAANTIAGERERRTLEFLFVTDLRNREIILGMLGARLANLFLLILTGLPIVSFLELFGGVDPLLVVYGLLATLLLLGSVGSLSMLISVSSRSAQRAVWGTYGLLLLLLMGSALVPVLNMANPFLYMFLTATDWLPNHVSFVIFAFVHGLVIFFCCRAAVRALRVESPARPRRTPPVMQRYPTSAGWDPDPSIAVHVLVAQRTSHALASRWQRWPPVGDDALLWKETIVERRGPAPGFRDMLPPLLAGGALLLLILLVQALSRTPSDPELGEVTQPWIRGLGLLGCGAIFVAIALNASGRVSRERERRTLEGLLLLPVGRTEILWSKWLASLLNVLWAWPLLGALWLIGVGTGGLSWAAVPLLAAAVVVYATFMATTGLCFSTVCWTTLRSTLLTLLVALFVFVGPGEAAFMLTGGSAASNPSSNSIHDWPLFLAAHGLSPIRTLYELTFRNVDLTQNAAVPLPFSHIVAAVAGLHVYALLTVILWVFLCRRFAAERGPAPRRTPLVDSLKV
jgi:ABC-type transport system involved in multi-copper enzyme maturation permease subunit